MTVTRDARSARWPRPCRVPSRRLRAPESSVSSRASAHARSSRLSEYRRASHGAPLSASTWRGRAASFPQRRERHSMLTQQTCDREDGAFYVAAVQSDTRCSDKEPTHRAGLGTCAAEAARLIAWPRFHCKVACVSRSCSPAADSRQLSTTTYAVFQRLAHFFQQSQHHIMQCRLVALLGRCTRLTRQGDRRASR